MKVLVGGLVQETNSFSSFLSIKEHYHVLRGADMKRAPQIAGFCVAAEEAGAEVVFSADYIPGNSGGPVEKDVVDSFLHELLDSYDQHCPIDGIFLDLHGATEIVGSVDGCGYILESIRKHVGDEVVIAHSSDMHANITTKMFDNANAIAGFQTYPHTDQYETGYRAAKLGFRILQGEPMIQARVRVPMIVPAEAYNTNEGPFADLIRDAHDLVNQGEILDFSIYQMQPWLNLEDAGSTVLVAAETEETATRYAKELAHRLFDLRETMTIKLYSVDEVIDAAIENTSNMPVILVDSADSPNAGSSADSSYVLERLLERNIDVKTCIVIADPVAASKAFEVGVGNTAEFSLGGMYEPRFQKAIKVQAYVKVLHDGIYPTFTSGSAIQRAGKTAVLQIGNIDIVVFTKMGVSSDPMVFRAFGIEPATYRLAMVKSATQYKESYRKFSTLFYPTDTPGSSTANLKALPFDKLPRPFYPLDEISTFNDFASVSAADATAR